MARSARVDNGYSFFIMYAQTIHRVHMRDAAINLRALPAQRDLIDRAATILGKNRSDFMLEVACERAQGRFIGSSSIRSRH